MRTCLFLLLAVLPSFSSAEETPPYKDPKQPIEARVDDLVSRLTLDEKLSLLGGTGFGTQKIDRLGIPSIQMIDGPQGVRGPLATAFPGSLAEVATWDPAMMSQVSAGIGREVKAIGKNMILGPCVTLYRVPQSGRDYECFGEDPYLNSQMSAAYVKGVHEAGALTSTKHFLLNNQEKNRHWINMHADERAIHELELPAFDAAVKAGTDSIMASYNLVDGVHASENTYLLQQLIRKDLNFKGLVVSDWESTYDGKNAALAGLDLEMPYGNHLGAGLKDNVLNGTIPQEVIDGKVKNIMRSLITVGLLDKDQTPNTSDLNSPQNRQVALNAARESIVLLKNDNQLLPLKPGSVKTIVVIGPGADTRRIHANGSGQVSPGHFETTLQGLQDRFGNDVKIVYAPGITVPGQVELVEAKDVTSKNAKGQKVHGFHAEYFDNNNLEGKPVITRTDPDIQIWNTATPDPKLEFSKYSARWTATLNNPKPGPITFDFGVTGFFYRFYVDGKLVKDLWDHDDAWEQSVTLDNFSAGPHEIRIEYKNRADNFKLAFSRTPPAADMSEAIKAAKEADAAIVVVGTSNSFEGEDGDRTSLNMPGDQDKLVEAVLKANPKTVVVVNSGGPVLMRDWRDKAPAILQAWFPGQEGGNAVADVITGKVNPSGKLPITIPKKLEDSPSAAYYHGQEDKIDYSTVGVLEGYRGYDAKKVEPEFPFGFGLSYTKFKYSNLKVKVKNNDPENPSVEVTMTLTNTGKVAGAEVAQLYVHQENPLVTRPPEELKGFQKVMLKPGESKQVTFKLDENAFHYWDTQTHGWKVDPDKFQISVGSSSRDFRLKGNVEMKPAASSAQNCEDQEKQLLSQKKALMESVSAFPQADWVEEVTKQLNSPQASAPATVPCAQRVAALRSLLENVSSIVNERT
ncbi:MAG: glycoside hydrolase family 3 C-terminal domain-containing protein, partial [Bdellovibrionota bacterium]